MTLEQVPQAIWIALVSGVVSAVVALVTNRVSKRQERSNARLKAIDEQTIPKKYEALNTLYSRLVDCNMTAEKLSLKGGRDAVLSTTDERWIQFREKLAALEHAYEHARLYLSETRCENPLLRLMNDYYKVSVLASAASREHILSQYAEMEAQLDVVAGDIKQLGRRDRRLVRRFKELPEAERNPKLEALAQLRKKRKEVLTTAEQTRISLTNTKASMVSTPEEEEIVERARQVSKSGIDENYEQVLQCLRSMLDVM